MSGGSALISGEGERLNRPLTYSARTRRRLIFLVILGPTIPSWLLSDDERAGLDHGTAIDRDQTGGGIYVERDQIGRASCRERV